MFRPRFKILGLKELTGRLENTGAQGKITVNEGLRKIGKIFVPAKGSGPVAKATPRISGKLAKSSAFHIEGGITGKQRLEITQSARSKGGAFYGHWVREGAKPHIIVPVRARMLRFEIDGRIVYARRVNHPGNKPNPYHRKVFEEQEGRVNQVVEEMGEKLVTYLAGD